MELLLIRHASAGLKKKDPQKDFRRSLSFFGRREVRYFHKLPAYLPTFQTIYTSPLVRAAQTAEAFWESFPLSQLELFWALDKLVPVEELVAEIKKITEKSFVLVGHEPQLSSLTKLLLPKHPPFVLEKGGAAYLKGNNLESLHLEKILLP